MGAESSKVPDIEIEQRNIAISAEWTMHKAQVFYGNSHSVSLFESEPNNDVKIKTSLLLERSAKNLLKYRHPCILKYISSWWSKGAYHLITEDVKPLSHVLENQSPLQICVGLYSILKAINFLHKKAHASHNNLCRAAIFVSPDGVWKLGGFEHLCLFSKLSSDYLIKVRDHRYQKAVAPEENSLENYSDTPFSIDQFAFGVLVEEVMKSETEGEVPASRDFLEVAKTQLQSERPSSRPLLSSLLNHDFFSNDFIRVYSFLIELPVKTEEEKKSFFSSLADQLSTFPETLVAKLLSPLLLARLVLLDGTAQECFLPHILCPGNDEDRGVLSPDMYRQYIIPQLLQIFCVRDAQIRLILLKFFRQYLNMFTVEQLKNQILPELLVGIKDTNDDIVVATLNALAELVPVLGAATVIGGKRAQYFTDGRPMAVTHESRTQQSHYIQNNVPDCDIQLSERLSPDGGEDQESSDEGTTVWSDWDNNADTGNVEFVSEENETLPTRQGERETGTIDNVSFLDIKVPIASTVDEINYFHDMEPVISKPPIAQIDESLEHNKEHSPSVSSQLFACDISEHDKWLSEGNGWEDDLDDWENNASAQSEMKSRRTGKK